jgi:NtrC-family two-component system sensor histidine kinase KinB
VSLRVKLLLAQGPLLLALILLGALSIRTMHFLSSGAEAILKDNYRSVLAAQRMKEAAERLDSGAVFILLGEVERGRRQIVDNRPRFEAELRAQEGNITEPGEGEATAELRRRWSRYQASLGRFDAKASGDHGLREIYFTELEPSFVQVKDGAETILEINQDAMVRRSERAQAAAQQANALIIGATLLALLAGLVSSSLFTTRLLRPLYILELAARRISEGHLQVHARVRGSDEIARLAQEFNRMAARLRAYRESTLDELLQSQRASQAAIDSLPDPVLIFGATGQLLSANRAAETELRVRLDAGSTEADLAPADPAVRATLTKLIGHVLGGKGAYVPKGFEESIRIGPPETPRYLLPRAIPVHTDSRLSGVTVVLQDVTRIRGFDELKNDLVATVAHEFRTPLTSLRMAIHLCLEGVVGRLNEKQTELLAAGREDCERLQSIVDNLLDLSRLQAGVSELTLRPVPAEHLLEDAVDQQRGLAAEHGLRIEVEDLTAGAMARADPERLQLVFSNLLANAVRHSPAGTAIMLKASLTGDQIRFEVHDQGPGVPPEFRQRIFERFFRVPGAETGKAGLGLYIATQIITAHDGSIGVEAREGGGSVFWFTLPRAGQSARS